MEGVARGQHPAYQKAVALYLKGQQGQLDRLLNADELNQVERKLILVRLALRKSALTEAQRLLDGIESSLPNPFLAAEHRFLRANLSFQSARFEDASVLNFEALKLYERLQDARGQFLIHYNLSADFNRLGLQALSLRHLRLAKEFCREAREEVLILRALACHHSNHLEFGQAVAIMEEALSRAEELDLGDRYVTSAVAADVFFRAGDWIRAQQLLRKNYRLKLNRERDRCEFELKVLTTILLENQNLRRMPLNVAKSPEFVLKWKILQHLQGGQWSEARLLWQKLASICPEDFQPDFQCKNESLKRGVFMAALGHLLKPEALQETSEKLRSKSQLQILEEVMRRAPVPLRKEELIEAVWGLPYESSLDQRFYRLISRLKSEAGLSIVCVNRTYRFAKTDSSCSTARALASATPSSLALLAWLFISLLFSTEAIARATSLVVTHAGHVWDSRALAAPGLQRSLQFADQYGLRSYYLVDPFVYDEVVAFMSNGRRYPGEKKSCDYYLGRRAPTQFVKSMAGEHDMALRDSHVLLAGGYFQHCLAETTWGIIRQFRWAEGGKLRLTYIVDAVYGHHRYTEDGSRDWQNIGVLPWWSTDQIHDPNPVPSDFNLPEIFKKRQIDNLIALAKTVFRPVPGPRSAPVDVFDYSFDLYVQNRLVAKLSGGNRKVRIDFERSLDLKRILEK